MKFNGTKIVKKTIRIVLGLVCLAAACYFLNNLLRDLNMYWIGDRTYRKAASAVEKVDNSNWQPAHIIMTEPEEEVLIPKDVTPPVDIPIPIKVDFDALRAVNTDLVGWLYCEDTQINYPVMHRDNQYYLNHLYDNTPNGTGTLFTDERNMPDFSDTNTIIYGHHMKSGAMFGDLDKYSKMSYYEEHPVMFLLTMDKNYLVEIVAACTVPDIDEAYTPYFPNHAERNAWLDRLLERSHIKIESDIHQDDCFVMLSTCDYAYSNARFIVLGKLVEIIDHNAQ